MNISPELKETVRTHPNIKEVYFSDNGVHYLNIHKDEPTGVYFGQFIEGRPVLTSKITLVAKRKDILGIKTNEEAAEQTAEQLALLESERLKKAADKKLKKNK